jgi:CHAT domain-containing protein
MSEEMRALMIQSAALSEDGVGNKGPSAPQANRVSPQHRYVALYDFESVQVALPDNLAVLDYVITDEGTYVFALTRSRFKMTRLSGNASVVDELIISYLADVKNLVPVDQLSDRARQLYDHLLAPFESWMIDKENICIIPDKSLYSLPFQALIGDSGHYFLESHAVSYAPSISVLARSLEMDRAEGTKSLRSVLAVGNPAFDPTEFPNLAVLPEAEREVREIASTYPRASVLIGTAATRDALLSQIGNFDVAHLSIHCLVLEKSPWRATLVLAHVPQASDQSVRKVEATEDRHSNESLLLSELLSKRFSRTRLVVLSGCICGVGRAETNMGLFRPFVGAGVPQLVLNLWPADSSSTAQLMIRFHKRLLTSKTADALRTAQLEMLGQAEFNHPYYWSSFILVGAT